MADPIFYGQVFRMVSRVYLFGFPGSRIYQG